LGLFGAIGPTARRLPFGAFGFWACFEFRASNFGFAGLARNWPIGFGFHVTLVFSPKTRQIGFVWRHALPTRPRLAGANAESPNHQ
jgi:hypothetical protein